MERLQLHSCSPSGGAIPAPPGSKCSLTRAQVSICLLYTLSPKEAPVFIHFPIFFRRGRDAHAKSACEQPQLGIPHRVLHLRREAGDGQKLQGPGHHFGSVTPLFMNSPTVRTSAQWFASLSSPLPHSGSAQSLLRRLGHHGDVQEEPRAVRGVLESRSRHVAEALQLEHGHHRCYQRRFFFFFNFTISCKANGA